MIRTIMAIAALYTLATLAGCATNQAVKNDQPAAATIQAQAPASSLEKDGSLAGDVGIAEIIPLPDGVAVKVSNDNSTSLNPIYFDFDSYLLSTRARETLGRHSSWLNENVVTRLIIEGHGDERGSDEYNMALSDKRAMSVRRYLETNGVNIALMETVSYGEEKPAMPGHDENSWAKNRRVEFVVVK